MASVGAVKRPLIGEGGSPFAMLPQQQQAQQSTSVQSPFSRSTTSGTAGSVNSGTTRPSMAFDPTPTAQSILMAGGSTGGHTVGFDVYGQPITEQTYQMPVPGYGNPTPAQQQARQGLESAFSNFQSAAPMGPAAQGGPISHVSRPSTAQSVTNADAAQSAAMGSAKAKAGSLGRASLEGLRSELAGRGWLGGGTEARGLVDRLAAATNPLADLNVSALHENVGLAEAAKGRAEHAADTSYAGDVSQRGQDVQMRGQDIQAQEAAQMRNQQALQGLMSAFSKLY